MAKHGNRYLQKKRTENNSEEKGTAMGSILTKSRKAMHYPLAAAALNEMTL